MGSPATLALGLLALAAAGALAQPAADVITVLPDFDDAEWRNLTMFAGYLGTGGDAIREVYYNFFEAEVPDPSKAPLILWLQGGPGCSSVGMGAFQEGVGPFAFDPYQGPAARNVSDTKLIRSLGSWTAFANLLFLDTPGPTGFSKASKPDDASWGDANATADNLAALLAFYSKFPGADKQRLFLAGQGYAGHTVPLLAQAVLQHNAKAGNGTSGTTRIPLQGIAVGNPWVDPEADNKAMVQFWFSEGLISSATYQGLLAKCDMRHTALWRTEGPSNVTGECEAFRNAAIREAFAVDLYGTSAPKCVLQQPLNVSALTPAQLLPLEGNGAGPEGPEPAERQLNWRQRPSGMPSPKFDPCAAWRSWVYLNRDDVQEAINAIQASPGEAAREWQACGAAAAQYSLESVLTSLVPVYKELADGGVRVLVYSGTADGVQTTAGTRGWLGTLGLAPDGPFRAWRDATAWPETAGYLEGWKAPNNNNTIMLATVLEAGHNAPYYKPAKVLQLVRAFVNNRLRQMP